MSELRELQRLVWLLANIVNGGRIDGEDPTPTIRFVPSLASYGEWACKVDMDFTAEGRGTTESTLSGSIGSCITEVRKRLNERLGDHWEP